MLLRTLQRQPTTTLNDLLHITFSLDTDGNGTLDATEVKAAAAVLGKNIR